ncbi:hypothetical protein [Pseudomonas paeninsulae]|uniref:hypothetical protein n=1 Tax=Pseudomonas paeninsulae TaxID=3110772 RepID=UPI002D79BCB1|nr:hypothetical protein [Pseudomonas sp. IT1137]
MKNETRALGFAPLIMPFAFSFYAFFADLPGFNMQDGLLPFIGLFFGIVLVGLPVVYIYEFFIGFRFYQLLSKKKRVNIFTLTLGGALIADIPMFLIWPMTGGGGTVSFAVTFQLFSFIGFMIGLNFWALLNFERLRDYVNNLLKSA